MFEREGTRTDRRDLMRSAGMAGIEPSPFRSHDETLEHCLLETQRQVHRLEEIVHRLSTIRSHPHVPPVGMLALIEEGNRRLKTEIDEFFLDSHALMRLERQDARSLERRLEPR